MYVFEYNHVSCMYAVVSLYREATWDVTNGYPSIMGVIDGALIGPPRQTCAAHNRLSHLIDLRDLTSQPIKTRDVTITLIMWIPLCFLAAGSIDRVIPLKVPGVLVQWPFRKELAKTSYQCPIWMQRYGVFARNWLDTTSDVTFDCWAQASHYLLTHRLTSCRLQHRPWLHIVAGHCRSCSSLPLLKHSKWMLIDSNLIRFMPPVVGEGNFALWLPISSS